MQITFDEKEIWDIIDNLRPKLITFRQIKKKDRDNIVTIKIIR